MISNNGGRAASTRGCNSCLTNDAFINRNELKILLYDTDPESCKEVSTLLTKCSYEGIFFSFYLVFCFITYQVLFLLAFF